MKIGDRVESLGQKVGTGSKGTIIGYHCDDNMFLVEFDKAMGGHDGRGFTKNGIKGKNDHCWYVYEYEVKLLISPKSPWTLVVHPLKTDPNTTVAIMMDENGKEIRRESVKRYYKDTDDAYTAIKAVMVKIMGSDNNPTSVAREGKWEVKVGDDNIARLVKLACDEIKKSCANCKYEKLLLNDFPCCKCGSGFPGFIAKR